MNLFRRIFGRVGHRVKQPEKHIAGRQVPTDDEQGFIASVMGLSKWADVEYYGPGAAEAEARRRRSLGLEPGEETSVGTIGDVRPD